MSSAPRFSTFRLPDPLRNDRGHDLPAPVVARLQTMRDLANSLLLQPLVAEVALRRGLQKELIAYQRRLAPLFDRGQRIDEDITNAYDRGASAVAALAAHSWRAWDAYLRDVREFLRATTALRRTLRVGLDDAITIADYERLRADPARVPESFDARCWETDAPVYAITPDAHERRAIAMADVEDAAIRAAEGLVTDTHTRALTIELAGSDPEARRDWQALHPDMEVDASEEAAPHAVAPYVAAPVHPIAQVPRVPGFAEHALRRLGGAWRSASPALRIGLGAACIAAGVSGGLAAIVGGGVALGARMLGSVATADASWDWMARRTVGETRARLERNRLLGTVALAGGMLFLGTTDTAHAIAATTRAHCDAAIGKVVSFFAGDGPTQLPIALPPPALPCTMPTLAQPDIPVVADTYLNCPDRILRIPVLEEFAERGTDLSALSRIEQARVLTATANLHAAFPLGALHPGEIVSVPNGLVETAVSDVAERTDLTGSLGYVDDVRWDLAREIVERRVMLS